MAGSSLSSRQRWWIVAAFFVLALFVAMFAPWAPAWPQWALRVFDPDPLSYPSMVSRVAPWLWMVLFVVAIVVCKWRALVLLPTPFLATVLAVALALASGAKWEM
ncbi:MAG: hypothetical protein ABIO40_04715 [Devosia sp.]